MPKIIKSPQLLNTVMHPIFRRLAMDKVSWNEKGWPVIADGKPSTTSEGPIFKH